MFCVFYFIFFNLYCHLPGWAVHLPCCYSPCSLFSILLLHIHYQSAKSWHYFMVLAGQYVLLAFASKHFLYCFSYTMHANHSVKGNYITDLIIMFQCWRGQWSFFPLDTKYLALSTFLFRSWISIHKGAPLGPSCLSIVHRCWK